MARNKTVSGSGGGYNDKGDGKLSTTGIYDKCDSGSSSNSGGKSFRKSVGGGGGGGGAENCCPAKVTKLEILPIEQEEEEPFGGPLTRARSGSCGQKRNTRGDLNESEETTPLLLLLTQRLKGADASGGGNFNELLKAGSFSGDILLASSSTTAAAATSNRSNMSENGCKHFQTYVKENSLDTYRIIDAYFSACINRDAREKKVCLAAVLCKNFKFMNSELFLYL